MKSLIAGEDGVAILINWLPTYIGHAAPSLFQYNAKCSYVPKICSRVYEHIDGATGYKMQAPRIPNPTALGGVCEQAEQIG